MSFIPNNDLQKQILKGHIWTGGYTQEISVGVPATINIAVGTKKTSFILELYTEGYIQVQITEGTTDPISGVLTDINMERSGSYSKETVVHQTAAGVGGSVIITRQIPAGLSGATTQFSGEAPLILKESTNYEYEISVLGAYPVECQLVWDYREIN